MLPTSPSSLVLVYSYFAILPGLYNYGCMCLIIVADSYLCPLPMLVVQPRPNDAQCVEDILRVSTA